MHCPRAHHYRQTYGSAAPSRSAVAGERYHSRTLGGELRRSAHGSAVLGPRRDRRAAGTRGAGGLPVAVISLLALTALLVGLAVLAAGAGLLAHRRRDRRLGSLVAIDAGAGDPTFGTVPYLGPPRHPASRARWDAGPDRAEAPGDAGARSLPVARRPGVGVLPARRGYDWPVAGVRCAALHGPGDSGPLERDRPDRAPRHRPRGPGEVRRTGDAEPGPMRAVLLGGGL